MSPGALSKIGPRVVRADTLIAHDVQEKPRRLAVTLADSRGRETTVELTAEVAAALAQVAAAFAHGEQAGSEQAGGLTSTRMPNDFAIGTGRFEPVVLIRFENDVPYGLSADHALRLGRALIAQAKQMTMQPPPLRQ